MNKLPSFLCCCKPLLPLHISVVVFFFLFLGLEAPPRVQFFPFSSMKWKIFFCFFYRIANIHMST